VVRAGQRKKPRECLAAKAVARIRWIRCARGPPHNESAPATPNVRARGGSPGPAPTLTELASPCHFATVRARGRFARRARGARRRGAGRGEAGEAARLGVLLDGRARGGELAGLGVAPGRAAVVSEEAGENWLRRGERLDLGGHVTWFCRPFAGRPRPGQWLALLDHLAGLREQAGLDLVVIDSLATFLPGDGNSAAAVLEAL